MSRARAAYRTPDDVFFDPAIRMPIRQPDASFGYLFFELLKDGRVVGTNGIQCEGRIYRLASLRKHLEYFGERVDVRVNPDDQREAIVFDRRTGAFVCAAHVDEQDATYDTRDAVTRQLIARVFHDGKELLRMAKENIEGAKERLAEYRLAKIQYLERRARENEAARQEAKAALAQETAPVAVIGSFSAVARDVEAAPPVELTTDVITEVLDADTPTHADSLCTVSRRAKRPKVATGIRHDGALSFEEIAKRLGTTRNTLVRYRNGKLPWPSEAMREVVEEYMRLRRTTAPGEASAAALESGPTLPARPRRTRVDGELSYANCAEHLGMSRRALERCKAGKRPWPEGKQALFEAWEQRRAAARLG